MWAALALGACMPEAKVDTVPAAAPPDSDTGEPVDPQTTAVLATLSDDYAVGALATIDLSDWTITDTITDLTGDAAVVAAGDRVYQLNRYGSDSVRVYAPGEWAAPTAELALEDLANPHDVDTCGEAVVISQYGKDQMLVVDPDSGLVSGSIDLSDYSDADGIPEASSIVRAGNGRLYVGLHHFDRDSAWEAAGGAVVEVDCDTRTVTDVWEAAVPDVYAWPADDSLVLIYEKTVGLRFVDTTSGELGDVVLATEQLDGEVVGLAAHGDRAVVALADPDSIYSIACLDLTAAEVVTRQTVTSFLPNVAGNALGEAWVSARVHWSDPNAPSGTRVFDIDTCTERTSSPLQTLLAPAHIAFY